MKYKSEKIIPYNSEEAKSIQVSHMFDAIASRYDTLNSYLSLGLDYRWRKKALKKLRNTTNNKVLDIATGTGDFAILASKILYPQEIIGIDISEGMMNVGEMKVKKANLDNIISFENQSCDSMNFSNESFDSAIAAFGIRNFENIDKSFQEILRVLKPNGTFLFLELSVPENEFIKFFYHLYSRSFIPFITKIFSKDKSAYKYLPNSIRAFPQGKEMQEILRNNGFKTIYTQTFNLGVCSLYIAKK